MTNLNPSWIKPLPVIPKSLVLIFLLLALLGFLDAAYLTIGHYQNTEVYCPITGQCETVLNSRYAAIGGVPVALLGAVYYLALLILTLIYLDSGRINALRLAIALTWAGFTASLVFVWLQLFVINAICFYCMVSATTSTLLFILGLILFKKLKAS